MTSYQTEKDYSFETSIGKKCYPPEMVPACENDEIPIMVSELTLEELLSILQDREQVRSCFAPEISKVFWQSLSYKSFGMTGGNPIKFTPPEKMDFIYSSCYQAILPELKIKEKYKEQYRMCWQRYVCFNLLEKAEIRSTGDTPICSLDRYGQEFCHAYMRDQAHTEALESDAGRDRILNTWTTFLPEQKRCCPLYWFYSKNPSNAFPLYKLKNKSLEHCFTFSKNIVNHLCMQTFVNGRWEWIKPDLNVIEKLPTDNSLVDPILFGEFTVNTPHEKVVVFDVDDHYYIDDIICTKAHNSATFGESFEVNLTTNGKLCRTIFGAVENITASAYNNRFNYTDNPEDADLGESPIKSIHVYYGDESNVKIGPCDMSHFRSSLISKHYKSSETNKGHFAIALDYESWKVGSGSGVMPDKMEAKLVCTLREKRPGDKDCRFNLHLRSRVSKKLTIDSDGSLICT